MKTALSTILCAATFLVAAQADDDAEMRARVALALAMADKPAPVRPGLADAMAKASDVTAIVLFVGHAGGPVPEDMLAAWEDPWPECNRMTTLVGIKHAGEWHRVDVPASATPGELNAAANGLRSRLSSRPPGTPAPAVPEPYSVSGWHFLAAAREQTAPGNHWHHCTHCGRWTQHGAPGFDRSHDCPCGAEVTVVSDPPKWPVTLKPTPVLPAFKP